ncbi:hypothetical protein PVAND_011900 [Polypedilum vanderplanki]|uniref:Odorant binding protein n=1 Tax=Polypedilum vanderplanki TaxID=319348 RepID=A0A9J6CLN4_POLVA|nr:hypothetical protein PVAND_011900 [Polypedilum vanderplanki]
MKKFLSFAVIFYTISIILCQTTPKNKELNARRVTRQCIRENKVLYSVAIKYSKGDMSDSSKNSKCFLKCFAFRLGLFNETTGSPQKEAILEYVTFLPSDQLSYDEIIDKCDRITERSEDQCDYVYRAYKCFWDEIKNQPEPESIRFSFYDVLGFNEIYDKEYFGDYDTENEEIEATTEFTENESFSL